MPTHSSVYSFSDEISALMSSPEGWKRVDTSNVLSKMVCVSQRMCVGPGCEKLAPSIFLQQAPAKLLSSCVRSA